MKKIIFGVKLKNNYWKYEGREIKTIADIPKSAIGFIYEIEDQNGKKYIGRKLIKTIRRPEVVKSTYDRLRKKGEPVTRTKNKKKSKKGKPVWRYKKVVETESNWKTYTGSNDELNEKIKQGEKITRRILKFCRNRKQMTYYEMKFQMCLGVIEENKEHFYNANISGKFFEKDFDDE